MYSMVAIVDNNFCILEIAERVKIKKRKKRLLYYVTNVLISLTVLIILQCVCIAKHHIAYLKYI